MPLLAIGLIQGGGQGAWAVFERERERERAASCERERKRDRESGEEMQCNYSRGGGCYKKKRKTETRGPLHDDIHFCYRKWYKGNMSLEEKITSYSLCPKKKSFSLPKKPATFNFDQIYLEKY
jgi:hypothetical protein